jgi:hypothetical protein
MLRTWRCRVGVHYRRHDISSRPELRINEPCRVYWGSHGCYLPRDHEGPHLCICAHVDDDPSKPLLPHMDDDPEGGNVGRPPYYGPKTRFYGEDW